MLVDAPKVLALFGQRQRFIDRRKIDRVAFGFPVIFKLHIDCLEGRHVLFAQRDFLRDVD